MRSVRLMLASALMAAFVLALPTVAGAQYVAPIEIGVSPNQIVCPGTVTVSGSGFDAGTDVLIEFENEIIATETADPAGDFSTEIVIDTVVGSHLLTVLGTADGREAFSVAVVECLGARAVPVGPALPLEIAVTGVNVVAMAAMAAGLLGGGAVAVHFGRRRGALRSRSVRREGGAR